MELILFCSKIIPFIEKGVGLYEFTQDGMAEILRSIGDTAYDAALRGIEDSKHSNNPKRELDGAVNCLRLAYEAFYKDGITNDNWKALFDIFFKKQKSREKAIETGILIATYYKKRGEAALTQKWCNQVLTVADSLIKWGLAQAHDNTVSEFVFNNHWERRLLNMVRKDANALKQVLSLLCPRLNLDRVNIDHQIKLYEKLHNKGRSLPIY